MGWILWIILGALAGWIASKIVGNDASQGAIGNIIVGIVGALLGGFLMNMLGLGGVTLSNVNLYSIIVAIGGAVLVLLLFNALSHRRRV